MGGHMLINLDGTFNPHSNNYYSGRASGSVHSRDCMPLWASGVDSIGQGLKVHIQILEGNTLYTGPHHSTHKWMECWNAQSGQYPDTIGLGG